MIRVGIIGGAGYTGGELVRLLLRHPQCEIKFVQSRSQANRLISEIHTDLLSETDMCFSAAAEDEIDVLFLCLGHGESKKFLENTPPDHKIKIIDLSQDFRLNSPHDRLFTYGLPEFNRAKIVRAGNIANPGCFATAIQLAHLPLSAQGKLRYPLHISAITGSTGAGQSAAPTTHFSWRHGNISLYKAFKHQHLAEIRMIIKQMQNDHVPDIMMLPFRGGFTRGILAAVYTRSDMSFEQAFSLFENYYRSHPFVTISAQNPDIKMVVNTNKAILYLEKHETELLIICVIDNLLKGASGQAVQNMNLMSGIDETCGLMLKPVAF
jgi:N-acetyl-gamma-glutamyl-phosphate reductase